MEHRLVDLFLRWPARIVSLAITVFILLFVVGEGAPNIINGQGSGLIPFLPWLGLAVAGAVLCWSFERVGAVLMIMGAVSMAVYLMDGRMALVFSLPYLLAGLLLLIHFFMSQRRKINP
jgi:hypothetical protein